MSESARARQAYADYVALGPGRSLEKLLERYQSGTGSAPTRRMTSLKQWSSAFGWQARLQALADGEAAAAEERQREYVRSIMEAGFALPHERVKVLTELAQVLHRDLTAEGEANRRWVIDVKGIGAGDNWQSVEIERFNSAEVEQFRGLLDDIAKETAGRPRTVKVDLEGRVRVIAERLGLDPNAAVAEVERLLKEKVRAAGR